MEPNAQGRIAEALDFRALEKLAAYLKTMDETVEEGYDIEKWLEDKAGAHRVGSKGSS